MRKKVGEKWEKGEKRKWKKREIKWSKVRQKFEKGNWEQKSKSVKRNWEKKVRKERGKKMREE